MINILTLSILLTLVYSWEEFKHTLKTLIRVVIYRNRNPIEYYQGNLDKFVGTLIMIGAVPIGLTFYLTSGQPSLYKLGWLALILFTISLIASGSGIFLRRLQRSKHYEGTEKMIMTGYSVLGLISPIFRMFGGLDRSNGRTIAKFAFTLSVPPLIGFAFKYLSDNSVHPSLIPQIDVLIFVLIVALFAQIAADFLNLHFRSYGLRKLSHYWRVVLGIILAAILLMG